MTNQLSDSERVNHWLSHLEGDNPTDPEFLGPFPSFYTSKHSSTYGKDPHEIDKQQCPGKMFQSPQKPSKELSKEPSIPSHSRDNSANPKISYKDSPAVGKLVPVTKRTGVPRITGRKQAGKKDVHVHLSLTDSDMAKLTSVLNRDQGEQSRQIGQHTANFRPQIDSISKIPASSSMGNINVLTQGTGQDQAMNNREKSPCKQKRLVLKEQAPIMDNRYTLASSDDSDRHYQAGINRESHVTQLEDFIPKVQIEASYRHDSPERPPTPSDRREKQRPDPLDLDSANRLGKLWRCHHKVQAIHVPITPEEAQLRRIMEDGTSSVYSQQAMLDLLPTASPLNVTEKLGGDKVNFLHSYNDWKEAQSGKLEATTRDRLSRSKSISEERQQDATAPRANSQGSPENVCSLKGYGLSEAATTANLAQHAIPAPPFSPLTPYLMGGQKASKIMIGERGWLKDTAAPEKNRTTPQKNGVQKNSSLLDSIKKKAREIAEKADFKPRRDRQINRITISLDAREQSLLYCELEYALSNSLDAYIKTQLNGGRLDPDKLKKVSDGWTQKGRPKVVGFRYDLETQLDLIMMHIQQFRFCGYQQGNEIAIAGLLHAMKINARAIRVRTFCQPDSVIAKQILDSQALLQMLGCSDHQQIALAEVSQFFKVIIERETAYRKNREEQERTDRPNFSHISIEQKDEV